MTGPKAISASELPSLGRLIDGVFGTTERSMFEMFPTLFRRDNWENLLIFADGHEVVAHVGMLYRWACIQGITLKVALIGAVATHPEYRGRGLASKLFSLAQDMARADGADLMLISGARGLYTRAGAAIVGRLHELITGERVTSTCEVSIRPFAPFDLHECKAAYAAKAAHFIRPLDDWEAFFASRCCMCRDTELFIVQHGAPEASDEALPVPDELTDIIDVPTANMLRAAPVALEDDVPVFAVEDSATQHELEQTLATTVRVTEKPSSVIDATLRKHFFLGDFAGYFVAFRESKPCRIRLVEYAGDMRALPSAIPLILDAMDATEARVALDSEDEALRWGHLLQARHELVPSTGTLLLLEPVALFDKLGPYFESRVGQLTAQALSLREDGGRYVLEAGRERLELENRAALARLIFGAPGESLQFPWVALFPLPALWYGLNYI